MKVTRAVINAIKADPFEAMSKMSDDDIASVIQEANHSYFNKGKPVFSDTVFDEIKETLRKRVPNHPALTTVGAPTLRDKAILPYWMGSMDKIKSDEKEVSKWVAKYAGHAVISDKLDGNSALLHVSGGKATLFTRGDGREGQNISHLLPYILGLPAGLPVALSEDLSVRGELIISRKDFAKVAHLGKNARNMVAGILNAKKPDIQIARLVHFVAYELIAPSGKTPSVGLANLAKQHFDVVHHQRVSLLDINVEFLTNVLGNRRKSSPYEIDGIVVMHDDASHLRVPGENPKHAFAYKSMMFMNQAEVVVKSVEWNVSKDGYIKPVVLFDGVELGGVLVQRATGINGKFISDNKIGPGAKITVTRSGDVIPAITAIIEGAERASMPTEMPYKWTASGCDVVVDTSDQPRDDISLKLIEFFFSKVKVNGLSAGLLKKIYDAGYDTIGKIVTIDHAKLSAIDGFKDKLATKIADGIGTRMKDVDQVTLMAASNCFGRGMGERKIQMITRVLPRVLEDDRYVPQQKDLVAIQGIEAKSAFQFLEGLTKWRAFKSANHLEPAAGQAAEPPQQKPPQAQIFDGIAVLFTGARSKEAEAFIVARGGTIKESISKNVDIVVCKDVSAKTSKLEKARSLGIKVMSLDSFLATYMDIKAK